MSASAFPQPRANSLDRRTSQRALSPEPGALP